MELAPKRKKERLRGPKSDHTDGYGGQGVMSVCTEVTTKVAAVKYYKEPNPNPNEVYGVWYIYHSEEGRCNEV